MRKKISVMLSVLLIIRVIIMLKNINVQPIWNILFCDVVPMTQKITANKMYKTTEKLDSTITLIKNRNSSHEQGILDETYEDEIYPVTGSLTETIGLNEIIYQPETNSITEGVSSKPIKITSDDIDKLNDIDFLKKNFYTVPKITDISLDDINVEEFINYDLSIDNTGSGPKILIIHTHSLEMYKDSDPNNPDDGIFGVGDRLAEILENKYNINTMHHKGRYDVVNNKPHTLGAYERMEPAVVKILKENPSIEVLIDLHRDGVPEDVHLVTTVNGKECAQIMYFNGISKIKKGSKVVPVDGLENPYVKDNLAFSFNMQLISNALYEHFTRKVYINAYRYSLHMLPKSLLIEVGAQTNTKQEALNSMEILAEILSDAIIKN